MIMPCEFRKKFRMVGYWVGVVCTTKYLVFEYDFIGILTSFSIGVFFSFPLRQRQSPLLPTHL